MEQDKRDLQKELFEEYNINKRNSSLPNQLQFRDKIVLKLSLESFIFFSIGIILACVIAFSFGVEKGKNIAFSKTKRPVRIATKETPLKQEVVSKSVPVQKAQEIAAAKQAPGASNGQSYVIQTITYLKPELAQKETDTLRSQGYQSYMSQSGKYYVVYVGFYLSEVEAKGKLKDLKQTYKDSFIKKISRRNNT